MRPTRLALVAAGLGALVLAVPASAATAPTTLVLTDAAGDLETDSTYKVG